MRQPIDSYLHGVLDYATGASLLGASKLPTLRERAAGKVLGAAGAGHIAYSLVTDYELAATRKVPYGLHLVVDAVAALGLVVLGATRSDAVDRAVLVGAGLYELGAVALSDPAGRGR